MSSIDGVNPGRADDSAELPTQQRSGNMTATGHFRCRKCSTLIDGMGSPCIACGSPQRVPVTFANGNVRYLPAGMTLAGFDRWSDGLAFVPPYESTETLSKKQEVGKRGGQS